MDETQQELILKLTKWLNTQESAWSSNSLDVTCVYFDVTGAGTAYQILKDEDGSFYVGPLK